MLVKIEICKKEKLSEEERIQVCFEVAGVYKEKLNTAVRYYAFASKCDEIFFFKKVKTLFTAEVKFYTYYYHLILFKTKEIEADKIELESFYKRKLQRKEKLRKEHPDFMSTYRNSMRTQMHNGLSGIRAARTAVCLMH